MSEQIVRIAARGDGVTASGRFMSLTAPGDVIDGDVIVSRGPQYRDPPCQHFPTCGGCQLQQLTDEAYASFCAERVANALEQHDLATDILPAHVSPPRTRRRASLKAMKMGGRVLIGFNEPKSHRIVDMAECHVLLPELFALLSPLRRLLAAMLPPKRSANVQLTLVEQGVDVMLSGVSADGLEAAEALTRFCEEQKLARLTLDEGFGPEARYEPVPATIRLGDQSVGFPAGSFLQATEDGEAMLVAAVRSAIGDANGTLFDLFAGLGTFAFAFAGGRQVIAAEAGRDATLSLMLAAKRAGLAVRADHRDLYRRPYEAGELNQAAAIILDPPRSGAEEQVREIAASSVPRIAYVSCNPATFAPDAKLLVDGGYRLIWVKPVGQFRWSTHVELAANFMR